MTQRKHHQSIKKRLIFAEDSPDFCLPDPIVGSLGTKGRECDPNLDNLSKCSDLCCNRNFTREVIKIETSCNCVFHWCCEVKCDKCFKEKEIFKCN